MNTLKDCLYRYDALDFLVEVEPVGGEKCQRFYGRERLVTRLQGQSSHSVFQYGKQLLALQSRQANDVSSDLLASDQQRSVLQVIEPGEAVRQAYTPYGHRRVESGPGSLLAFAGEAVDPVTGHYLLGNGYRAFNPVLMRFNSPDRLSPFGRGGLNPYAYCLGDPVNFSDPTGQIARLATSLLNVSGARIMLGPAIPYKLGKDALQWGAAGQLPLKHTVGAASGTVVGVTVMLSALTGVGSAIAGITGDSEAAAALGFVALGLAGLTVTARVGSGWAARDPKTIPSLKWFVENKGRPVVAEARSPSPILTAPPLSPDPPAPSAPPLSPDPFAGASAPPLTPSDSRFTFSRNNQAIDFLNQQIDRQVRIAHQNPFCRHSDVVTTANNIRRRHSQ